MKYWTEKDLEYVRSFLPTDVTAETEEALRLKAGDFFLIHVRRYGASICLKFDKDTKDAVACKMPIYLVEEDRYEPRWREKFGKFDNAIGTDILAA